MKILLVLFVFCAVSALASEYQRDDDWDDNAGSSGLTRLKPDLVVEIEDDRDAVPGGYFFYYTFVVKNIRALAQAAKDTDLIIDFDDSLWISEIDYRCMPLIVPAGGSTPEITEAQKVYMCTLGRVHALGSQVVIAKVIAPTQFNGYICTTAQVECLDEGEWVQDNNMDSEKTLVFALLGVNANNLLQTTSNHPAEDAINTYVCRFAATEATKITELSKGYSNPSSHLNTTGEFDVQSWVRCFRNSGLCVNFTTSYEECNCFDPEYQPMLYGGAICECRATCPSGSIMTDGGCHIVGAERLHEAKRSIPNEYSRL